MSCTLKSPRSSDKGYVAARWKTATPYFAYKSRSERDKYGVGGTNRERANVRARDRLRDAAPRCLISASGASEALGRRDQSASRVRATTPPIARAPLPFSSWLPTTQSVRERSRSVISSVRSPISLCHLARIFRDAKVSPGYQIPRIYLSSRSRSAASANRRKKENPRRAWEPGERSAIYRWQACPRVDWLTFGRFASRGYWKHVRRDEKRTEPGERIFRPNAARTSRDEEREKGRTWVLATLPRRVSVRSGRARFREIARSRVNALVDLVVIVVDRQPTARILDSDAHPSPIPVAFARNEMRDADHRRRRV